MYINPELQNLIRSKHECYGKNKNFTTDYLFFCSTIGYLKNVDRRYVDNEYVPIHSNTMKSIISKGNYDFMVSNLKKWKVISATNSYLPGSRSKGYKLLSHYNSSFKKIPIDDKLIIKKLKQFKMRNHKEIEKLPSPYQYLSMTNTWIDMDATNAMWYNEVKYLTEQVEKYNANLYSIFAYEDNWYRFSVDTTGNRIHTNLTNLSSELRQYLSVDGQPLGQVDISNSQPLFFYLHIKNLPFIPDSEKDKYRTIVESGKFYEYFMGKFNIPPEKRQDVKHKILAAIFFDWYRKKESRYIKVFKKDFPKIANYIKELRKKDYRQMARLLQRTESKFVIEGVVAKFMEYFGQDNEFIATIHDSIVVKTGMLDAARWIMEECFWAEGIQPKLKMEKFANPSTQPTMEGYRVISPPLCHLKDYC